MRKLIAYAKESLLYHARHLACTRQPERPLQLLAGCAFISFTFDDFPASAIEQGGAILERYEARGTFYWCGSSLEAERPSVTRQHLKAAVARGHEVGCHTFSHLDCASAQRAVLEEDLTRNAAAVTQVLSPNGPKLDHFAYPYGKVNPRARRIVARRFRTGRGIYPGINQGWADAALLMANGLYGPDATYRRAIALIGAVAREGGWLIFFTHDVSDQPSPYGAQAVALERVVRAARESGCLLLPVGEVAEAVRLPWSDSHERRERDIRRELES